MRYRSVMVTGKAKLLDDFEEKVTALKIFMQQYSERKFEFSKPAVDNINIICIEIEKMTGRKFEYL